MIQVKTIVRLWAAYLMFCLTLPASWCQIPSIRRFATQEYNRNLLLAYPELLDSQKIMEERVVNFIRTGDPTERTLLLIFHVIQSPDMPTIGIEQIISQVNALNRDFNNLDSRIYEMTDYTSPFIERTSIPLIKFCLPDISHQFYNELPIFHILTQKKSWEIDNKIKLAEHGGSIPYMPENHVNIWVCDLVDTVSGYAQMPGGPNESDGIVIDYTYFGANTTPENPYAEGKTLTHLMGSYLGLCELWNDLNPCFDDKVYDTPIHNEANIGQNFANRHISTCFGNEVEMTMNFMDNTDDVGMYMFTRGQMMRMQASIAVGGPRNGLASAEAACNQDYMNTNSIIERRINPTTKSNLINSNPSLEIFPNPTYNILNIAIHFSDEKEVELSISDVSGHAMWQVSETLTSPPIRRHEVSCREWPKGVYMIILKYDSHFVMKKVVIQ